ncbi:MAG: DUF4160 domain-containing protein [Bacteriovoracaceae bacterium]|nr:DUF4160 domain-containing protein [Bacteriovoracaceae bacterium]
MGKFKKAGYIFKTWTGDHLPKHVHVYSNGKLVLKWDLQNDLSLEGRPSKKILKAINELRKEGKL